MTPTDIHAYADEIDRLADVELARRALPPFRPDWELIVCRHCGRRMFDDDGTRIRCHRWWQ